MQPLPLGTHFHSARLTKASAKLLTDSHPGLFLSSSSNIPLFYQNYDAPSPLPPPCHNLCAPAGTALHKAPEVGNVSSTCNGVTPYRLCHVFRAITFRSSNSSNFDRAITLRRYNGFNRLEVITFRSDNFSPLC
jgi:hypothetical protein